ncbi:MAG: PASTA domain-containing protein [Flavobacteriales bacterium]
MLLANLLLALGITYVMAKLAFNWLDIYTRHDHYVTVPDLSSLTLGQAIVRLDELKLTHEVDTSRYDPFFIPYHILAFAPEAGDHVKPGRSIFIQANAGTFKSTTLPDVIYKNKRLVLNRLAAQHLIVKNITYVPDIAKETVLKVLYDGKPIQAGVALPYQAELDLVIGQGYEKNVLIPDVIGMDLPSAQTVLEEHKFVLGGLSYDQPLDTAGAKVYRQDFSPGEIYDQGQCVNLWLTTAPQEVLDSLIQVYRPKKLTNPDFSTPSTQEGRHAEGVIPPPDDKKRKEASKNFQEISPYEDIIIE